MKLLQAQESNRARTSNFQAGAGIFWGDGAEDNRAVRLPNHYSVAASELAAIVVALYTAIIIRRYPRVLICSDHFVSLKSAIQWAIAWQQNGWIKRTTGLMIRNALLVKLMAHLCKKTKCAVYFLKVNSRKGDKNWRKSDNKKADELAEIGRTSEETFLNVLLNLLKY
ncbi:Protein RNH-1.0 c [Aphelenchoides avenae]|nr:Protein RNH-1.0 c [Aphelenchus avenae]KAH7703213.1 Protein RNH-1.0 c [Aphelenchus avenae]